MTKDQDAYNQIISNIKVQYEKTGKVQGKKYEYWNKHTSGDAIHRAHMIAISIIQRRKPIVQDDKQLLDEFYEQLQDIQNEEAFNSPDYQHVHGNGYDPER